MSKIVNRYKIDLTAKKDSFSYQTQAFLSLKDLDYCAIFHEQGLGKTKIAIDLLLYWVEKRDIDTVLIVTKKILVNNWMNEFAAHTYLKPKILNSNRKDNFYIFNSPCRVIVTNFETISMEIERVELFLKCRNVAIIIDESTKIKNPETKLARDFFKISELFKIKVIMTGTPVANRPYDIWAQIYFLDKGRSLGTDFESFKIETDLSNHLMEDMEKRKIFEDSTASIFKKISDFSVRETKKSGIIKLPQKEYVSVRINFEKNQKQMYEKVVQEMKLEIRLNDTTSVDDESVALKRLLRLNQITSNPGLIDDRYVGPSSKEIELSKILTTIISNNEKVIVWSTFKDNVTYFHKQFSFYKPAMLHGSMSIEDRNEAVSNFLNDSNCMVLFATPQAAKEGLTLTVANHVVFYDRGFNLDDYLQAQDRIHRISQTKTCYVYNLMIRDSIDGWIDSLLEAKQFAAFLAQGDISINDYQNLADYKYSELIKEILNQGEVNDD